MLIEYKPTVPKIFKEIFNPHRYKIYHGGRGGGKSETIARYLLKVGMDEPMTILCAREFQASIKDSVHQLLADVIRDHGIEDFYQILKTEIRGVNGTKFVFAGLHHNISSIKSIPNIKKCWVEEAETVSDHSWAVLIPTIRADDSEIIVSYNPELPDAPTHQRFVVNRPKNALVQKVNYTHNPYFPQVLRQEMEELKERDHEEYMHVWEGECRKSAKGAVFADEITKTEDDGRILHVPYDTTKPVDVFFDLGRSDLTSIWFAQLIGYEYRILRYYDNNRKHFSHYIKYLKELEYTYGTIYLPHDATHETLSAEKSIETQARAAFSSVKVLDRIAVSKGIEAARAIFPNCYFDSKLCVDGLSHLRRYAYKIDEQTGKIGREPDHNINSHGADAFRYFAMAMKPERKEKFKKKKPSTIRRIGG